MRPARPGSPNRLAGAAPAGGDSTALGPVKSPDRGRGTGRWGFHSFWAGEIPGPPPRHRPVGIPQLQGRWNPRTGAAALAGGDSTAFGPVKSPDRRRGTGRWGFHSLRAGGIPGSRAPHRPVGIPQSQGRRTPGSRRDRNPHTSVPASGPSSSRTSPWTSQSSPWILKNHRHLDGPPACAPTPRTRSNRRQSRRSAPGPIGGPTSIPYLCGGAAQLRCRLSSIDRRVRGGP
jgi:hypothetical protein